MKLTGNEQWVIAGTQGATIWARKYGNKDWWWPIVNTNLDSGLITIDVCGMPEVWHLSDCAQLRINENTFVENEDFCESPSSKISVEHN